jgi:hypothetical protein
MSFVVFAGPSLFGANLSSKRKMVELRPPAARGDVASAMHSGARRIGIIDGLFGDQPSVGHKEILAALAKGVPVIGAASMGALRAAECHVFGMIGVGRIFRSYYNGTRTADADVAIVHAPAEMNYLPLSEAVVDIEATLEQLTFMKLLSKREERELIAIARGIHFSVRTWRTIIEAATLEVSRKAVIAMITRQHRVSQKQIDALELLEMIGRDRVRMPQGLDEGELSDTSFIDG